MNKQIEQVKSIMTEHAERETSLEWVLSTLFFQVMQEEMENKNIQ